MCKWQDIILCGFCENWVNGECTTETPCDTSYSAFKKADHKKCVDAMAMEVGIYKTRDLDGESQYIGVYGKEMLYDCHQCDVSTFNRESLTNFFFGLIKLLDMEEGDLHFWDDVGVPDEQKQIKPETIGTSAIQFILTSNITVHTLDKLGRVYVNVFSCKDFDDGDARRYIREWFRSKLIGDHRVYRK